MKLESPYINPINFSNGSAELESASYRSVNTLNCQEYLLTDTLQFIIYFEANVDDYLRIESSTAAIGDDVVFTNAVEQTFGNAFYYGKRRFNKGYIVFRSKLNTFLTTEKSFTIRVGVYGTVVNCELLSNKIAVSTDTTTKLLKYSNTYDNSVCDFSLLTGLFEYRFNGLFYKTQFPTDAEVFQGVNMNEVVSYKTNEQYILNIGGQDMMPLEEERKIRHILGCNVKIIDNIEFELTPDINIESSDLFRRAGRSLDITLARKQYQQSVMQVASGTGGTITTNRPVTYDTTAFTFAVDPSELTAITVTDSANRTTLNKTLINEKDIVKVDFGINQNLDADRTIDVTFTDSVTTKTVTITQKFSGLLFGDAIMNKNLILRKLP
jgi:hypothetical protein